MRLVKPLYIWWITNLAVATGVFWAWHSGIIAKIWYDDVTMITSVLSLLYVVTTALIGYVAYTKDFASKIPWYVRYSCRLHLFAFIWNHIRFCN